MVLMISVRRFFSALIGSILELLWVTLASRCHTLAERECERGAVPGSVNSAYCQGLRALSSAAGPVGRLLQRSVWSVSLL